MHGTALRRDEPSQVMVEPFGIVSRQPASSRYPPSMLGAMVALSLLGRQWANGEQAMLRGLRDVLIAICAGLVLGTPASAQSVEQFYKGKRLTMLVGSPVGGGYDAYARMVSRHLGRFIPGNPTFVVQNMPGAAGAVAAGYLYNIAPKD